MDNLDVARWQFGITTVYHFLFVPLTIGLAFLVAGLQTAWYRTSSVKYLRLTKFFGKLFLVNFAMGVVTGIVQEFQFGMNWSDYSRFVGDIFGAPLAMEGLLSFFLESTFLGLWIFGWDRLSERVHLAAIWLAAFGTFVSAYFILAANSFMQNPVGYRYNEVKGRVELTSIWDVLTNKVVLVTFPHTIAAAMLTGGAMVLGVSLWRLYRYAGIDADAFRTSAKLGAVTVIVAALAVAVTGDRQAKVMTEVQPMKMAAAEALYETKSSAGFSVFTIGSLEGSDEVWSLRIPGLLSFLGEGSFDAEIQGIDNLQSAYEARYGPGDYTPSIPITYWTFRLMIGVGLSSALAAVWVLVAFRRGRLPRNVWCGRLALALPLTPLLGNSFGWIFTEMGRQPWIVFGLMPTSAGVSPGVSTAEVLITMIGFTLVYGLLAFVEVRLLVKAVRDGLPAIDTSAHDPTDGDGPAVDDAERPLAFAY